MAEPPLPIRCPVQADEAVPEDAHPRGTLIVITLFRLPFATTLALNLPVRVPGARGDDLERELFRRTSTGGPRPGRRGDRRKHLIRVGIRLGALHAVEPEVGRLMAGVARRGEHVIRPCERRAVPPGHS